jgi:hypothetical protein
MTKKHGECDMVKEYLAKGTHVIGIIVFGLLVGNNSALAEADQWIRITGVEKLRTLMSGTEMEWEEPDGGKSRGVYRADGTGTLYVIAKSGVWA